MATRFSKPLTVLAATLVIAAVVGMAATAAFAIGANPAAKIAIHVKAHPTSCTKGYPVFTDCNSIVETWATTGDVDVMPVFYDLTQYTVVETGLLWPEGDWLSASWIKCKGDIAVGSITHSVDAGFPQDVSGTAIAWTTCQTGTIIAPGYAWLAATTAGSVTPAPNPATADYGVVDCTPEPGPYYQLPVAIASAGIGGAAGDDPCLVPACNVNPTSLDFGTVLVGGWQELPFTITNTGSGRMTGRVRFTSATDQFIIVSGGEVYDLANGESVNVVVRFTPTSTGTKTCEIENESGGCSPVACTGVGDVPPVCQVSPTSLSFGTVVVGETSDKTFTIKNTGGGTLTGSVSESCAEFSIEGGGGAYSLTNNQTVTVTVRFAPTSGGAKDCTVETGAAECVDVSCTGTGQQSIVPLTISKDDAIAATACAFPGGSVTYTVSYTNPNTSGVNGVVVTDYLPTDVDYVSSTAGGVYDGGNHKVVWTVGAVGAGGNGAVSVVTTVKPTATPGGTLANSCDIVSTETPTPVVANHSTAVCACAISGVEVVCPESHNDFTGPNGMTSYAWSVSGSGTIVGSSTGQMVQVLSGATCGETYTLTLDLVEPGGVGSSCQKVVTLTDSEDPIITCPGDALVRCNQPTTPAHTGEATAIDNCDLTPTVNYSDSVTPGSCPQAYSIARTWVATDGCGNSATCLQTITVVDDIVPVITCPANTSVECGQSTDPASTGTATATDVCDASPAITHGDVVTPGACPQEYSIARTWIATDDCGNSATCLQTITVEDTAAPVITCPGNILLECGTDPTPALTGEATASDLCDASPTVTYGDVVTPGSCPEAYSIARTWIATDDCGNSSTCVQIIVVVDDFVPVLTCAANERVTCGTPIVFTDPSVSDNCDASPDVIVASTDMTPGPGEGEITHTRTWTATDNCGNSAQCSQTITEYGCAGCIITGPATLCPGATGNYCAPAGMDYEWSIMGDGTIVPPVTTQCVDVVAGPSCSTQFMLVLSLNGGAAGMCTTGVYVRDQTPPVLTCPPNHTVECPGSIDPGDTGWPETSDGCDPEYDVTYSDVVTPGSCPAAYSVARTWRATDGCGNSSTCVQTLTVVDTTAPVITCPGNTTVECDASTDPAQTGTATATDVCDPSPAITHSDAVTPGGCADAYSIARTWIATDDCGNSSTCVQTLTVVDTTAPTLVCAADEEVSCGSPIVFTDPTASDNCDASPDVTISDEYTQPGGNPGEVDHVRCWVATDACGNTSLECCQTITETGCTGCTIVGPDTVCPGGFGSYSVALPAGPGLLWTISGDGSIIGAADQPSVEVQASSICGASFTLAFDRTDPADHCEKTVAVNDMTPPSVTPLPDVRVECGSDVPAPDPSIVSATDNCGPISVIYINDVSDGETCPETIARTYVVRDYCSNETPVTQVIRVWDTVPPVIVCPQDAQFECSAIGDAGTATATDNCDLSPDVTSSDRIVAGPCPGAYVIERTWTATDDCLNQGSCVQRITIVDTTPPTIVCGADGRIGCTDPLVWTTPTVSDDCNPSPALRVVSTDSTTVPGSGEKIYTRCWEASDGCGNLATCCQTITRDACPLPLRLTKEDGLTGAVAPGDSIFYAITIYNDNATAVTNVSVIDMLPDDVIFGWATSPYVYDGVDHSVSWTLASIAGLGSAMLSVHVQVDPLAGSGSLVNVVSVTSDQTPVAVETSATTVVEGGEVGVYIDIKPGSCPNSVNPKAKGVLPVAVLGTADFDVTTIDPSTLRLTRAGSSGSVAPMRWAYEDVATPFVGDECGCHEAYADGYMDLTLKFSEREVIAQLGLGLLKGQTVQLVIAGALMDGTPLSGGDCVRVLGKVDDGDGLASLGQRSAGFEFGDQLGLAGEAGITFAYFTSGAEHVRIDAYDVHGRLVRTLVDQSVDAGSHSVSWNLMNASGQKVPTGIYFVRLTTRTESETKKVVVVE